jgi:3',5'-cyclic AMP phosphodiesterase CpdA
MRTLRIFLLLLLVSGSPLLLTAREKAAKPYFFIQLTDPQFGMADKNKSFTRETEWYEKAVREINRLKPEFVVITGDLVNDQKNASQIAEFKRITALISKKIPVWYTPGNHDIGNLPDSTSIAEFIRNYGSPSGIKTAFLSELTQALSKTGCLGWNKNSTTG